MAEPTARDQLNEVNAKLADKTLTWQQKDDLIGQALRLNRQITREGI